MLRIAPDLLEEIRRHGESTYPAECCGVIAGRAVAGKEAVRLYPMANRRIEEQRRYLIEGEDLRRLEPILRDDGLEIVGYYHSHPDHPAAPSAYDIAHAWPWYSYLILSVSRGQAGDLAAWELDGAQPMMHPEPLEVYPEV